MSALRARAGAGRTLLHLRRRREDPPPPPELVAGGDGEAAVDELSPEALLDLILAHDTAVVW